MVANMGVYNTGDSLAGVRGSELPRASDSKPLSSSSESMSSGSALNQMIPESSEANDARVDAWKKLTAGELGKVAGNGDSAEFETASEDFVRGSGISGKSPRKLGFMPSDPSAQPPMKKECLATEKAGCSSTGSGTRSSFDGSATGSGLSQRSSAAPNSQSRQIPISAEALFGSAGVVASSPVQQSGGSLQGTVASAGGLLNTLKSPVQTAQAQAAMAQSQQLLMQLLEQQHAMQLMHIQQLHAAAAMGNHPLLSHNSYLESTTRSLAEQLNRSVTGVAAINAVAAAGVSPKTSTPKGKIVSAANAPAGTRNSSGYLTDSSYNTSAENSLHELVSKIALQGPNHGINDALSTSGTSGATGYSGDASASLDLIRDSRWTNQSYISQPSQLETSGSSYGNVDQLAENHRKSAASSEATCTWVGQLPPKNTKNPQYSCKVFLGGVPWDITESMLQSQFKQFGPVTVDWPGKEKNHGKNPPSGKGYVYLIFENEKAIRSLLTACTNDFTNCQNSGEYYFKLSSKRTRSKEVQVIPWAVNDSNFSRVPQGSRTETQRTVFVGALHGMLNAEALANIMNDLFGGVTFAGIDTDKYKYPIGSGRVAFNNDRSYMKAVSAGFIEIKANKFSKKVQVDPYLDDHLCSQCAQVPGQYFCREVSCFTYYCLPCWNWHHSIEAYKPHVPLTRNSKVKNNIVPPVTAVSHMPTTHFGMQLSNQNSSDGQDVNIPGMSSAFQPFATSGTGGIGGCEALGLNAIMNMNSAGGSNAGTGSVNVSCAGAAGLFQPNPGASMGMQGAIEAMN